MSSLRALVCGPGSQRSPPTYTHTPLVWRAWHPSSSPKKRGAKGAHVALHLFLAPCLPHLPLTQGVEYAAAAPKTTEEIAAAFHAGKNA